MSLTKEAIKLLQDNAVAGKSVMTFFDTVIMPDGYHVQDLEEYQEQRNHFRMKFQTHLVDQYLDHLDARHGDGNPDNKPQIFVNQDDMSAVTIFDMGTPANPLHCKDRAVIKLKRTPEYHMLDSVLGRDGVRRMNQTDLAELLEDYGSIIQCGDGESDVMPIKKAIAAVRRVKIKAEGESSSEIQNFSSNRSSLEKIESTGDPLPAYIVFVAPAFYGLKSYPLKCRLSLNLGDSISFTLRCINWDKVMEACATEFSQQLASRGNRTTIGTIDPR